MNTEKRLLALALCALFAASAGVAAPVVYTKHATERLEQRRIEKAWVERVVENPERLEPDRRNGKVRSAYGCIEEAGMVLHVVYTDVRDGHLVITEYFDERAERRGAVNRCVKNAASGQDRSEVSGPRPR